MCVSIFLSYAFIYVDKSYFQLCIIAIYFCIWDYTLAIAIRGRTYHTWYTHNAVLNLPQPAM